MIALGSEPVSVSSIILLYGRKYEYFYIVHTCFGEVVFFLRHIFGASIICFLLKHVNGSRVNCLFSDLLRRDFRARYSFGNLIPSYYIT